MRQLDWATLDESGRQAALARPGTLHDAGVVDDVRMIIASVRARGDRALSEWSWRFDGCDLSDFIVSDEEF